MSSNSIIDKTLDAVHGVVTTLMLPFIAIALMVTLLAILFHFTKGDETVLKVIEVLFPTKPYDPM
jgi:hypothetical protein